jgi:hypothetical protein
MMSLAFVVVSSISSLRHSKIKQLHPKAPVISFSKDLWVQRKYCSSMHAWKVDPSVKAKFIKGDITIKMHSKLFHQTPNKELKKMTLHGVTSNKPSPIPL